MKKIAILSILVLLASWWVVGQSNSESPVDDCNYEEVCKDWCEDPDKPTITFNNEPPIDDCNYEEVCKDWCEDPGDEEEDEDDELCIPMNNIIFDLNIGILKIVGYIDLQLNN